MAAKAKAKIYRISDYERPSDRPRDPDDPPCEIIILPVVYAVPPPGTASAR